MLSRRDRSRAALAVAIVTLLVGACAPAGDAAPGAAAVPVAPADAEAEQAAVIAAHSALVAAYETADAQAFANLLDPSSELLIFHPRLTNRFSGIEQARAEMGRMFARLGGSSWLDVHPSAHVEGDVAWLTSHVLIESPNLARPFVGRGTEIWVRRPTGWRLSHGHWSTNPEAMAP